MFKACDNYGANYFGPTCQPQTLVFQVSQVSPPSPSTNTHKKNPQKNPQKIIEAELAYIFIEYNII